MPKMAIASFFNDWWDKDTRDYGIARQEPPVCRDI